jgi:SPP1 family predicted phage head-tail adaptor
LQGRERFAAQQVSATVSHEVRMRYFDGLTSEMRLVHNGRVLAIDAVMNTEERGREWVILCTERTDA